MDRGTRRSDTERAKVRMLTILYGRACGPSYRAFERPLRGGRTHDDHQWWMRDPDFYERHFFEHPWRAAARPGRWTMSSCPKAWRKATMVRPARSRQNGMLRRGDFDGAFPDYRRPHIYFW